jgi:hypothetical protein
MGSGLYQDLVDRHLLISHAEVSPNLVASGDAYKIIQPEPVIFISYPYEWSFSQLKDAALTTLVIQKCALERGMSLKDASAYNIQFHNGQPVLIDTLSFERYQEGNPWTAYRQFCQHFLAPLALMSRQDVRLNQLLRVYIDGVPLDLASTLLPFRTRFSPSLLMHIHLHATAQKRYADQKIDKKTRRRQLSRNAFVGLIDSLQAAVRRLTWTPVGTEWADYYTDTNYNSSAETHKRQLITDFLSRAQPQTAWDLGANTGRYSRLASDQGIHTVACDIDPGAVELNYLECKEKSETHTLPLVIDLTNPSSDIGWHHKERDAMLRRGPADVVMALALVHHLAIGNNVPLDHLADFFSEAGQWLIIEFVPKSDSQVQRLLAFREDIFSSYNQADFEKAFAPRFQIHAAEQIRESERSLYLMQRRQK